MKTKRQHSILTILAAFTAFTTFAAADPAERWAASLDAELNGQVAEALSIHEKILQENINTYAMDLRAGWLHYLNGQYRQALEFYKDAAGRASGALAPLYGTLNCHLAVGNTDKVVRTAKAILVLSELDYTGNYQLASAYYKEGRFSLAASYYRKLHRLFPEDLAVNSGLGWSLLEGGEADEALPLFEYILMVSPDYAYAQKGMDLCRRILN